jgi:hypothetical protein
VTEFGASQPTRPRFGAAQRRHIRVSIDSRIFACSKCARVRLPDSCNSVTKGATFSGRGRRSLPDNQVIYGLLVAPEREYAVALPVFERMMRKLEMKNGTPASRRGG